MLAGRKGPSAIRQGLIVSDPTPGIEIPARGTRQAVPPKHASIHSVDFVETKPLHCDSRTLNGMRMSCASGTQSRRRVVAMARTGGNGGWDRQNLRVDPANRGDAERDALAG